MAHPAQLREHPAHQLVALGLMVHKGGRDEEPDRARGARDVHGRESVRRAIAQRLRRKVEDGRAGHHRAGVADRTRRPRIRVAAGPFPQRVLLDVAQVPRPELGLGSPDGGRERVGHTGLRQPPAHVRPARRIEATQDRAGELDRDVVRGEGQRRLLEERGEIVEHQVPTDRIHRRKRLVEQDDAVGLDVRRQLGRRRRLDVAQLVVIGGREAPGQRGLPRAVRRRRRVAGGQRVPGPGGPQPALDLSHHRQRRGLLRVRLRAAG